MSAEKKISIRIQAEQLVRYDQTVEVSEADARKLAAIYRDSEDVEG